MAASKLPQGGIGQRGVERVLSAAFFSTLGPKLGLRRMAISRHSFGLHGAKIMALFNVAACIGWSLVNVIVGVQIVTAISGAALLCAARSVTSD